MVTGATPAGLFEPRVGLILVAVYLTFAITAVTCPASFEEDMLVESRCLDGGKESELVILDVKLV